MRLSQQPGNPASAINDNYQELMGISCPDQLRQRALELLGQGGISARNRARFQRAVREAKTLDRLRGYLTNFLLAADGLAVL